VLVHTPAESIHTQIDLMRDFNRYYARRLGVLTDRYLGQDRPLAEARLLFELGQCADVRDLRTRLGLDTGYLSRLLRSLEQQDLVRVTTHPRDGRARITQLTDTGARELAELNRRSSAAINELLEPLTPHLRDQIVTTARHLHHLLRHAAVDVAVIDAGSAEARQCLHEYAAELVTRFPEGYASSALTEPEELRGHDGSFLVAREEGRSIGCVAWHRIAPQTAEIRHLWVHDQARGLGVGRRLLHEIESDAGTHEVTTVCLGTHTVLTEAIALYRSSGYHQTAPYDTSPYNHLAFEKTLTDINTTTPIDQGPG
jgi:DNA-binding MarR family transcriptional regulator/GNAT superfamily N-acetyltransferase